MLATGKQDFVTDGERVVLVQNGSAALSGITGTGCMVGALTAAFLPGCEDNIAKEMTDSIEAGVWSGAEMELNGRSGNYLAAAVLVLHLWVSPARKRRRFPAVREAFR